MIYLVKLDICGMQNMLNDIYEYKKSQLVFCHFPDFGYAFLPTFSIFGHNNYLFTLLKT